MQHKFKSTFPKKNKKNKVMKICLIIMKLLANLT